MVSSLRKPSKNDPKMIRKSMEYDGVEPPETTKFIKIIHFPFAALESGLKNPEQDVQKHQKSRRGLTQGGSKNGLCHQVLRPSMFGAKHRFSQARRSVGPKYFLHFLCFRKLHFSRFASHSGPKMPPEADSWRLRIPFSNRVRGPFWRPKNRFARRI